MLMFVHSPGCTLNQQTVDVTGNVGQSVLLPCSCSELQAKPHTFRWSFLKGSYPEIFPKDQTNRYTDRVQLFNDHPPGNLSLLISHLTVEDEGWYRCEINNKIKTRIYLAVKGCTLKGNRETEEITAYTGGSVLLPCSCTDLHIKPKTFTWEKNDTAKKNDWVQISPESDQYKERYQLVHDHPPGNLSLLISHLTVEDGGWYRCEISEMKTYIYLTVKEPLPYIPIALVTVIFLHIIVAVVYCITRKKGPGTVHYSRGDGDGRPQTACWCRMVLFYLLKR
ncbi:cell adhesion molecule DSCAM-like [Hemibagrus wyckioides]|uniref:cell adhesion molecule DSCAM-like n=1 Tax=Hemibagrus wyckioides TaxID=337641 RepID=UPI00266D0078|nr:cell adhesion molecule DSCAM-like [Hemibagrus wyckioides]